MVGDDEKARGVVGIVLDIGGEDVQTVKLRRRFTGNGTGLRVFRRQTGFTPQAYRRQFSGTD